MQEQDTAVYIPLATERTKRVVRDMQPGITTLIDLVNVGHPYDRKLAEAWVVIDGLGKHLRYSEGGRSGAVEISAKDQMRLIVEEPAAHH